MGQNMSTLLSSSLRSNLNSASLLSSQLEKTQERISTGRKVNSASDDAYAYFTEIKLRDSSSQFETLNKEMDRGMKTLQAAVSAIKGISDLADRAKSLVQSAKESADADERDGYRQQILDIVNNMQELAKSAEYRGVNLLGDSTNSLTLELDPGGNNSMTLNAASGAEDDFTNLEGDDFGFDLTALAVGTSAPGFEHTTALSSVTGATTMTSLGYAVGDKITLTDGTETHEYIMASGDDVQDFLDDVNSSTNFTASLGAGSITYGNSAAASGATVTIADTAASSLTQSLVDGQTGTAASATFTYDSGGGHFDDEANIDALLTTIEAFKTTLQSKEGSLANNEVIAEAHQAHMDKMVSLLSESADNLVAADIEEESVKLNVLQTRQQLAMISLQLATQQEQNVMRLF